METYVKSSLENVKLFLAPGSSFLRVYPRKGFDRALARFARNLEVSLNNPRQTSYVEPEVLNKSDKLPKIKENQMKKKKKVLKLGKPEKIGKFTWHECWVGSWYKCNDEYCLFLCKILWSLEHVGLSLRLVMFTLKNKSNCMTRRLWPKLYGPSIYYALFSINILLLNVKICFY